MCPDVIEREWPDITIDKCRQNQYIELVTLYQRSVGFLCALVLAFRKFRTNRKFAELRGGVKKIFLSWWKFAFIKSLCSLFR